MDLIKVNVLYGGLQGAASGTEILVYQCLK